MNTKVCSKCKIEKPLSEFHKDKSKSDGLVIKCKQCSAEYARVYYKINKDKIRKREYKYRESHKSERREYWSKYRELHKEEIQEKTKKYNKSKARKKNSQKYYNTHKKEVYARNREYLKAHPEKYPEYRKKYNQSELGRIAIQKANHIKRALKFKAKIENFKPSEVFKRDDYICQLCGIKTRPDFKNKHHLKRPELDHIIPLSKGGEHSRQNTQCLCRQCNMKKHNKTDFGDQLRMFG